MTENDEKPVLAQEQGAWRELLRTALVELDSKKLPQKIEAARNAIFSRMEQVRTKPEMRDERTSLQDGLSSLRALEKFADRKDSPRK
jgi:hypothetical protein